MKITTIDPKPQVQIVLDYQEAIGLRDLLQQTSIMSLSAPRQGQVYWFKNFNVSEFLIELSIAVQSK